MAIASMKKLTLVGMDRERDTVLSLLQKMGCVEIIDLNGDSQENGGFFAAQLEQARGDMALLLRAVEAIERTAPQKSGFLAPQPCVSEQESRRIHESRAFYLGICSEIGSLEDRVSEAKTKLVRIGASIAQAAPYGAFDAPLSMVGKTQSTVSYLGIVSASAAALMTEEIGRIKEAVAVEAGWDREGVAVFILAHSSAEHDVHQILQNHGFASARFFTEGRPSEVIASLEKEKQEANTQIGAFAGEVAQYAQHRDALKLLYDDAQQRFDRLSAAEKMICTKRTFAMRGWVAAQNEKPLADALNKAAGQLYLAFEEPEKGEEVPTVIVNSRAVAPFETVTDMFSTPSQRDIDPNKFILPFFVTFFGMMMGDAGYGILMAVGGWLFVKLLKPRGNAKNIAAIIAYGGITTTLWGVLTGSWFSIGGIQPILFNPMYEPLAMMGVCFGIGTLHIFTGMSLSIAKALREGDWQSALFDNASWIMLLTGLILLMLPATSTVGAVLSLGGAGIVLLFAGRKHGLHILKRLSGGIGALYGITGYLSDILSYSRIFAMGLAGAAIGIVFNTIAGLFMGNPFGFVIGVLVLIVGHTFNIAINALGAYIHTCRLQYIEFFGKFYEGGGMPFRPFTSTGKYNVQIRDNHS